VFFFVNYLGFRRRQGVTNSAAVSESVKA